MDVDLFRDTFPDENSTNKNSLHSIVRECVFALCWCESRTGDQCMSAKGLLLEKTGAGIYCTAERV